MLMRPQGRLAFATCATRRVRCSCSRWQKITAEFEAFARLSLGDWVGATGKIVRTRQGRIVGAGRTRGCSWPRPGGVSATSGRACPTSRRGFRQREVDLWANERTREILTLRSRLVSSVRRRLEDEGFVEVETPVLHAIPGGALAKPFVTHHNALDADLYLRIAPELYLKRLVVGGFEKVFEIARVFRNEGLSPRHNPEFTMLELYQAYADYRDLAVLVEELVSGLASELVGSHRHLVPGPRARSHPAVAARHHGRARERGHRRARRRPQPRSTSCAGAWPPPASSPTTSWGAGKLLLELYEKTTEPNLWGPVYVMDYPAEVSPLARRHRSDPDLVERFEPVVAGRELGNAFSELVDPDDQRAALRGPGLGARRW